MYLENVVIDAVDPHVVGAFWEGLLGCERLTDEPDGVETRLSVPDGPVLDLCLPRVPEAPTAPHRLRLDVAHGVGEPGDHADPEGSPYRVLAEQPAYAEHTGPLVAIALESADPARDAAFWAWLTGWTAVEGALVPTLRHPSRRGALLELRPEASPKGAAKNSRHLDVRLEPGETAEWAEAGITERGGRHWDPGWGELPWRSYTDPSGNELCVLPVSRS